MIMSRNKLNDFLSRYAGRDAARFHMPGHKGRRLFERFGYARFFDDLPDRDITEIPGADNLFHQSGVLKDLTERYRRLYDCDQAVLLINGSSCGLEAAVLAAARQAREHSQKKPGEETAGHPEAPAPSAPVKIITERSCHKSVLNGMTLAGTVPAYIYPEIDADSGLMAGILPETVEQAFAENPDAGAVIITSPNYYGIRSDIAAIAEITHRRGAVLIVDEAHGAHLKFFDDFYGTKTSAGAQGADIVVASTHKTLASFTQTAVACIHGSRVDPAGYRGMVEKLESSSPSYILLSSLEINADILENHAGRLIPEWQENLDFFYHAAKEIAGLDVLFHPLLDRTKINISMKRRGLSGTGLERALRTKDVFAEMVSADNVMLLTGIGNRRYDYERLISALRAISEEHPDADIRCSSGPGASGPAPVFPLFKLKQHPIPRQKEAVPLNDAAGRICAAAVIPYPPGIPLICPGEEFEEETVRVLREMLRAGQDVMGVEEDDSVLVGK